MCQGTRKELLLRSGVFRSLKLEALDNFQLSELANDGFDSGGHCTSLRSTNITPSTSIHGRHVVTPLAGLYARLFRLFLTVPMDICHK